MSLYDRIIAEVKAGNPPTEQQARVLHHVLKWEGDIRPSTQGKRKKGTPPLFGTGRLGGEGVWRLVMQGLVKRGWVKKEVRLEPDEWGGKRKYAAYPITPDGKAALVGLKKEKR